MKEVRTKRWHISWDGVTPFPNKIICTVGMIRITEKVFLHRATGEQNRHTRRSRQLHQRWQKQPQILFSSCSFMWQIWFPMVLPLTSSQSLFIWDNLGDKQSAVPKTGNSRSLLATGLLRVLRMIMCFVYL